MSRTKQFNHSQTSGKKLLEITPNKQTLHKPVAPERIIKKRVPGTTALDEIKKYQKSTALLISQAAFRRLVRKNMAAMEGGNEMRFTKASLQTLQTALEAWLINVLEDSGRLTVHAKRKTLFSTDIQLVYKIKYKYSMDPAMIL